MSTPVTQIERLRQELASERNLTVHLRARLAVAGHHDLEPIDKAPAWTKGLRPGHIALMTALIDAYPRGLDKYVIEELLPKKDHASDRSVRIVDVYVTHLRQALGGKDVIETIWGKGYRCGEAFYKQLQGSPQ